MTPIGSIRVIKRRRDDKVIFSVPRMIPINHYLRHEDVVSMDPGVRSFMTTYDTSGFCSEWGSGDMKRIFPLCLFLDRLISKVNGKEIKNLHGKKGRKKRRNINRARVKYL